MLKDETIGQLKELHEINMIEKEEEFEKMTKENT